MKSQRPKLEALRQEVQSLLALPRSTPSVEDVIEDFWNSYSELETAISEGTTSLSVDTLRLGASLPEYKRYSVWKGAGKLLILLAILVVLFQWNLGMIIGLVGFALHKYGEHIRKTDGQRFMQSLMICIKQGEPGAMANLCAHYIAGTIELFSDSYRVCWPLYPSNVLTGRDIRVSGEENRA